MSSLSKAKAPGALAFESSFHLVEGASQLTCVFMSVYLCLYVCVSISVYLCLYVCVSVYLCICVSLSLYVSHCIQDKGQGNEGKGVSG